MNSSGIKRGLAFSAVSALAVAGIPALASSANAAVGDSFTVTYTGPALNGGGEGALVILRAKDGQITPADVDVTGASSAADGSEDTADQTVDIVGVPTVVQDSADAAYEFIHVRVGVTTTNPGDTASFRIFEDDAPANDILDAGEARQAMSISTAGPLAAIDISPLSQSTPQGVESGAYTVTLKDSAGRTTQLEAGDGLSLSPDAPVLVSETGSDTAIDDGTITSDEIVRGTDKFTADPNGAAVGSYDIVVADTATPAITKTATLNVTPTAVLSNADIDVVTGADSSDGAPAQDPTYVRVDQSSVRLDIASADAADKNANVTFTVTGNGLTFGGEATTTVTTTLDANGVGSVTITPDAGTVQEGDGFAVDGSGIVDLDFVFQRSAVSADSVDAPSLVYTQVDTPTSVTVTVTDQFGIPVQGAQVSAASAGTGVNDTEPRQTTNASGQTTFTFPAGDTQVGDQDTITYTVYQDAATPDVDGITASETTTVKYTADGKGPDYQITLDTLNTEGSTYTPDDVSVIPLTDAVGDDDGGSDETAALTIANGEAGAPVTVSVDNGALILDGTTSLADAKSSVTGVVGDTFQIVGTTSGIVTVTTTSGSRTETAQLTVAAQDDTSTARNVGVSGPAEVEHGTTQIPFVAVVTDAFGNPVPGVLVTDLNIQVTGPAQFQDSDVATDANGQITLNVRVDADAEGPVTIKVTGIPAATNQFGAAADRLQASSGTDNAKGLTASSNVGTATTTVKAAPVVTPRVNPELVVSGRGGAIDRVKGNAINKAAGAKATLWKNGKKVKSGVLNDNGNITFRIKDRNGAQKTKYVVKIGATSLTFRDQASKRIR